MRGTPYAPGVKEAVLALGASGATYVQIQKKFPIPKGTLSCWFQSVGKSPAQDTVRMRAYLEKARIAAHIVIRKKKETRLALAETRARESISLIDLGNSPFQKSLLAMLYWAEGSKSDTGLTIFTNTDPLLISLYVRLLRSSFVLNEMKFRVRLHLHFYHDQQKAIDFLSNLTDIPKSQFGKIHVKKRSTQKKFRENFQGICFIIYNDVSVRRELMALGRLLAKETIKLSSFNG